jgi:putative tricarboxylic transport membrane protein
LLFCLIGVYTVNNNAYEILIMLIFGLIGYLMRKTGFEPAPLLFAMVIGPIMETALRQSLLHSRGNFSIFFTRPISAVLLCAGILLLFAPLIPRIGRERETIVKETPED